MSNPTVWWNDTGTERQSVTAAFNAQTNIATVQTDSDPSHVASVAKADLTFINYDARGSWNLRDVPVRPTDEQRALLVGELLRELTGVEVRPEAYKTWRLQYLADVGGPTTRAQLKLLFPDAPL